MYHTFKCKNIIPQVQQEIASSNITGDRKKKKIKFYFPLFMIAYEVTLKAY